MQDVCKFAKAVNRRIIRELQGNTTRLLSIASNVESDGIEENVLFLVTFSERPGGCFEFF